MGGRKEEEGGEEGGRQNVLDRRERGRAFFGCEQNQHVIRYVQDPSGWVGGWVVFGKEKAA